ncbi:MAG: hypothetical protein Q8O94_02910 [bacterium]|nr:hypothetical protein [bacterium]
MDLREAILDLRYLESLDQGELQQHYAVAVNRLIAAMQRWMNSLCLDGLCLTKEIKENNDPPTLVISFGHVEFLVQPMGFRVGHGLGEVDISPTPSSHVWRKPKKISLICDFNRSNEVSWLIDNPDSLPRLHLDQEAFESMLSHWLSGSEKPNW